MVKDYAAVCAIFLAIACADERSATSPAQPSVPVQRFEGLHGFASAVQNEEGRRESLGDYFGRLADSVPGFGGLYYDANGDAVINLTDDLPQKKNLLANTLKHMLSQGASGRPKHTPGLRFAKAKHDYKELLKWKKWTANELMVIPGATTVYIDAPQNIVVVGAKDAVAQRRLMERVRSEKDAPIIVAVSDYIVIDDAPPEAAFGADSLTSNRESAVGGMQFTNDGQTGVNNGRIFRCTLGFNAQPSNDEIGVYDHHRYAVTAGHCTPAFGAWDGGTLWNASYYSNPGTRRKVGVEWRESDWLPPPSGSCVPYWPCYGECPTGAKCSIADASLIAIDASYGWEPAKILRTTFSSSDNGATPGSLEVLSFAPRFTVEDSVWLLPIGTAVGYMGVNSGFVSGFITRADMSGWMVINGIVTDKYILDQDEVNATTRAGDSGAPVFFPGNNSTNMRLAGMVIGGRQIPV
jgi:hypothetical protein